MCLSLMLVYSRSNTELMIFHYIHYYMPYHEGMNPMDIINYSM